MKKGEAEHEHMVREARAEALRRAWEITCNREVLALFEEADKALKKGTE